MVLDLPTQKEFAEFSELGLRLHLEAIDSDKKHKPLLNHWYTNPELIIAIRGHCVYFFFQYNKFFSQALNKFKHSKNKFYDKFFKIYGKDFAGEMPIYLMRIFALSYMLYLSEAWFKEYTANTGDKFEDYAKVVDRNKHITLIRESICNPNETNIYHGSNTEPINDAMKKILEQLREKTPCLYIEKKTGHYCERKFVHRLCHFYFHAFNRTISYSVIQNLANIILSHTISPQQLKQWIVAAKHDLEIGYNLGLSESLI